MCYYGEARFLALPLGELSAKLTERVFPFSPRLRWLPGVTLSVTAYRRATSPRVGGKVYVAGTMCNTETNPNLNEPPTVGWEAVEYNARTKITA